MTIELLLSKDIIPEGTIVALMQDRMYIYELKKKMNGFENDPNYNFLVDRSGNVRIIGNQVLLVQFDTVNKAIEFLQKIEDQ